MDQGADVLRKLEAVCDRASFLDFVRALASDRRSEVALESASPSSPYGAGARGWESTTIESFLEAAASWAADVQETGDEREAWFPGVPSWAAFAKFLYAGKIYE
ncbi:MAG: hypothetical protein KIS78_04800 [Labilithrix sp.]|nr:hypothetical protein [Labilithrix sp.]